MAITATAQTAGPDSPASEVSSGGLGDVLDVILDKGLVIDAMVRVSLVGIEILTIDARIVVASVDTYMHFAREAHRLQLGGGEGSVKQGLGGAMAHLASGGAESVAKGALRGAGEGLRQGLFPAKPKKEHGHGVVQRAVGAIREALSSGDEDEKGQQPAEDRSSEEASRGSRSAGSASQGGQGPSASRTSRRSAPASRRAPSR